MNKPRFIDLFAGIGGMHLAFKKAGCECVFTSEWDKYAQFTYKENFNIDPYGDITAINASDIPDHDILVAGFPCQPFSIAGVSKKNSLGRKHGFMDVTQGTLFFDVARIISEKRPRAFMLENVKNLKSHDGGRTFGIIKETLGQLGYTVLNQVLDGKMYVPQHRERIFIIGFDQDSFGLTPDFQFPNENRQRNFNLRDILEDNVDKKYTLTDNLWQYLQDYAEKHRKAGNGFGYGMADLDSHSRTLSARYYKDGSEILIPQEGANPRRLTPRECARLQGYPEDFRIPVSDTQAYKQFGNSVVVPLVQAIAQEMVQTLSNISAESKQTA